MSPYFVLQNSLQRCSIVLYSQVVSYCRAWDFRSKFFLVRRTHRTIFPAGATLTNPKSYLKFLTAPRKLHTSSAGFCPWSGPHFVFLTSAILDSSMELPGDATVAGANTLMNHSLTQSSIPRCCPVLVALYSSHATEVC